MNGTHVVPLNGASLDKEMGNNSASSSPLEDLAVQSAEKVEAGRPNSDPQDLSRSSSRVTNGLQTMLSRVRTAEPGRDLGPPPDGSSLYMPKCS